MITISKRQLVMISFVNLDPIALFSDSKLSINSRTQIESDDHAHVASLMYNLLNSNLAQTDSSIAFEIDRSRSQAETSKK